MVYLAKVTATEGTTSDSGQKAMIAPSTNTTEPIHGHKTSGLKSTLSTATSLFFHPPKTI